MVSAALATRPRKPNNVSRQVARLAASHQISKRRQLNSGPKTATIQYFAAPSSERPGPNRAATIRRASRNAGQALSGRNCLREPSGCWGVPEHFLPLSDHSCGDLLSIVVEQTSLRLQENLPPQTHPRTQHLGHAPSVYLNIRYGLVFSASKRLNFNWSHVSGPTEIIASGEMSCS